jgi:uncharacterized protein YciI
MTCLDHENGLGHRMEVRERHLAYAAGHADKIKIGGPLLDGAGQMIGSFFVLDVPSRAEAEAFNAADPYSLAGVFARVEIHAYRNTLGALP